MQVLDRASPVLQGTVMRSGGSSPSASQRAFLSSCKPQIPQMETQKPRGDHPAVTEQRQDWGQEHRAPGYLTWHISRRELRPRGRSGLLRETSGPRTTDYMIVKEYPLCHAVMPRETCPPCSPERSQFPSSSLYLTKSPVRLMI